MNDISPLRRLRSAVRPSSVDTHQRPVDVAGALLRRAGRGDEDAFSGFYDATISMVFGVVLKVVRDRAMAEEVTQEVFVELWRLAPRYEPDRGSAMSWAATIAHRRAVDRVRSEQARRQRDQREQTKHVVDHDQTAEAVADNLDRLRVRDALEQLSDTQREAVTLAYYGGRTYREVAALLDIPEGTAKTRIRDGLIRLRDQLGVTS